MSNMSYCRWENTYNDLKDCYNSMVEEAFDELSESEANHKELLLSLAKAMLEHEEERKLCLRCGKEADDWSDGERICPHCGHRELLEE